MPRLQRAPVIVVTGGAGVGKTTVAAVFRKLGARVLDVDRLARRLLKPGEPAWREVLREFCGARSKTARTLPRRWRAEDFRDAAGCPLPELPWAITPRGTIRRTKLGATVFAYPAALQALNRITHPRLRRLLEQAIRRHRRESPRPLVLDMAVYPERPFRGLADAVLWVRAPEVLRQQRLTAHRRLTRAQAADRVHNQWPDKHFQALADFILPNRGSELELRRRAQALWPALKRHALGGAAHR